MHSKMPWISLHETFAFGLARVYYSAMGISQGGHLLEYLHNMCLRKSNTTSSHMQLTGMMAIDPFLHT